MIRDRLRRWATGGSRTLPSPDTDPSAVRLYTAPWVLPGASAPIRDGAVAVALDSGRVLAIGERSVLQAEWRGVLRADLDGILMPGMVNANAHLELTALTRSVPRGIGVRRWLRKLAELQAETDRLDAESREAQLRSAVRRSLTVGTAAVGEITHSLRPVPAMGREGLYGVVFHELVSKRRMAKALAAAAVQKAGIVPWPDGIRYRLAPEGLRSAALTVLKELAGVVFEADGRGVVERALRTGAPVVLCPRSELHLSGAQAPLISYLESGCRIALGTNSTASSPDLSVLQEAAELHAAYPEVPAMVLLRAATEGGADALGLETMGALEPGRAPGLLHVTTLGRTPDDPCGWLLRAGQPDLSWLVRAAPPPLVSAA